MTTLWRSRPPIDWAALRVILALAVAAGALVFTGATLAGIGETRLGVAMMGAGCVVLFGASLVRW